MYRSFYILLTILALYNNTCANDSISVYQKKKIFISSATAVLYSGSLIYLNQIWYKPYQTSSFHFFNDNAEWFLMDKFGHSFTAYYTSLYLNKIYKWAGFKHSDIIGSSIAFSYLLTIEIMDGYSSGWGFSWGDFSANTLGTGLFYVNQSLLHNLFVPKFSFYPTSYPKLNPSLLGKNFSEQIIKDYNGQTYWLSISPFYKWKKNMEWLCLSFGYGIDGCIGARSNIYYRNNQYYDYSNIKRERQFYLSIDIDLSKIKTEKKWLNKILNTINWIKIPAPALEWKGNNLYLRPLLFSN